MNETDAPDLSIKNALVICSDETGLPAALFAAHSAALLSSNRSFDICICSLTPLPIPAPLQAMGIRNIIVPVMAKMAEHNLSSHHLPLTTYLRLWLPDMLNGRYERLLYADYDTRFMSPDLNAFFDINLGPHPFGAVLDKRQWHHQDTAVLDFAIHNIASTCYLNSGVMLIDVAAWTQKSLTNRILNHPIGDKKTLCHDQSLINLAVEGQFAQLSPVWNWQIAHHFPNMTRRVAPKILHFTGFTKPWHLGATPSVLPPEHIRAYHDFFAKYDLPDQFDLHPNAMRLPPRQWLRRQYKQCMARPRLSRLMADFPDPFQAKI